MDKNTQLCMHKDYVIRKELFGGILFHIPTLSVMKVSKVGEYIFEKIVKEHFSLEQLLAQCLNEEQRGFVDYFINQMFTQNVIQYYESNDGYNNYVGKDLGDAMQLSAPIFVWWDITKKCNLKCFYCYSDSGKVGKNELTKDEIKRILNEMRELGVLYIYFLGGEPFARPDFLEILKYARSLGFGVMIATNGTLITEEVAKVLSDLKISNIRVSIDGDLPEIHDLNAGVNGAFKNAMNGITNLKKYPFDRLGLSATINKTNVNRIEHLVQLATKIGVQEIQLTPLCETGRGVSSKYALIEEEILLMRKNVNRLHNLNLDVLVDSPEGILDKNVNLDAEMYGCTAGYSCLAIQEDGKVAFCILHRDVISDLRNTCVKDAWRIAKQEKIKVCNKDYKCDACKSSKNCQGACLMMSKQN